MKLSRYTSAAGSALLLLLTSCGTLIGTSKPVAEHAENYRVADLAKSSPAWVRVKSVAHEQDEDDDAESSQNTDIAYQSKDTGAIIALNSSCRASFEKKDRDLKVFTRQLLLGFLDVSEKKEIDTQVAGVPALETTIQGTLNGKTRKMRVTVLKKGACVYDLMYLSTLDQFKKKEEEFKNFVASLELH